VTKIFSPLSTYASPSSSAVARIAAESEPASGSVIAIAAHLPPSRSSCSSVATEATWASTSVCSMRSPRERLAFIDAFIGVDVTRI